MLTNTGEPGSPTDALRRLAPNSVRRPGVNALYLVSLWLVTGLCVLIPVIYVGLIAGVGWLELQYYTEWAPELTKKGLPLRLLAWFIPGVTGLIRR